MITFEYDDNVGSADKRLIISVESPCFEWVIWGKVEDFARVSALLQKGGDYVKAGESNGRVVYWSRDDGDLWVLHGDMESWDIGLRLSDDQRKQLIKIIELGPKS